jgi:CheY-like chemotaxis protein
MALTPAGVVAASAKLWYRAAGIPPASQPLSQGIRSGHPHTVTRRTGGDVFEVAFARNVGWREGLGSGNVRRLAACHAEAMALRCLIVDDSPQFLEAARGLLEREGIVVVGVATNGADAVRSAAELRPDVSLVDIDLGGQSGFDVVRRLQRGADLAPSVVILISTHAEQDYADLIAASPATGFLPKTRLSAGAIRDLLGLPA